MRHPGLWLERVGPRAYVRGEAYPVRETLKLAGAQWDRRRKGWWVSSAKVDSLLTAIDSAGLGHVRGWREPPPESGPGMRATIGLNVDHMSGDIRHDNMLVRSPWVARITGRDPKFELRREFVRGKRDYSEADKKGRGLRMWFVLEPGVYEVWEPLKRYGERRFFLRVTPDGAQEEITRGEVDQMASDYVFSDLNGDDLRQLYYLRAEREGVSLARTTHPQAWRGVVSGHAVLGFYGLMRSGKTKWRFKGLYVMPDARGKRLGTACILDAMDQARMAQVSLEALAYCTSMFERQGWRVVGEPRALKNGKSVWKVAWDGDRDQA